MCSAYYLSGFFSLQDSQLGAGVVVEAGGLIKGEALTADEGEGVNLN